MLRSIIIVGLAIASSVAYAAPFAPSPESSVHTVHYTFTGFCDGLTLAQNTNGIPATGFPYRLCRKISMPVALEEWLAGKTLGSS